MSIPNPELIQVALSVLNRRVIEGRLFGDVGAALMSAGGSIYSGISVDTHSWGLCAERSALAAMITAREYRFSKIVAVWREEGSGYLYVLPPCGICREFMRNIDAGNLNAEIVLDKSKSIRLRELLPLHVWPSPLAED